MNVVKIPQTDVIAVAPGCFDLPQAQGIDLCDRCKGEGSVVLPPMNGKTGTKVSCETCDGNGYLRVRLVTAWRFTQEEWDYLASLPLEDRGIYLSICAAQTPPVNITVGNPFEIWEETVPLKQYYQQHLQNQQDNG